MSKELNIKIAKHLGFIYVTHQALEEMRKKVTLNNSFKPGWYRAKPINVDYITEAYYLCRNHNELSFLENDLNYLIKALDITGEYYQLNSKIEKEPYECVISQGDDSLVVGESQNSLAEAIYKALGQIL